MERKHYLSYYVITFVLACLTFYVLCIHNLRLEIDYGWSYFAHMLTVVGVTFLYNLLIIHVFYPAFKSTPNLAIKCIYIILIFSIYLFAFYGCSWLIIQLPEHFLSSRVEQDFFKPIGNLLYFEKSAIQFLPIFTWISCLFLIIIPIEKYALQQQKYLLSKKNLDHSKLSLLRMKMNPHFLFNELNNIHSLLILNDNRYFQYLDSSIDLANMMIQDSKEITISLDLEIKSIEKFLILQQIRYGQKISVAFNISKTSKELYLPQMTLMTLVENAVKHCDLSKTINGNHIEINLSINDNILVFTTKNTYNLKSQTRKGIGLKQLEERLSIHYGNHYKLSKNALENVYEVHLRIRLHD